MDAMADSILQPDEHVLSTLERDGSRRWLKPRLSPGKWWRRRRVLAYLLIAVFTGLPFVKVNGEPFILLDIAARRFTIFGFTFLPTDTVLLAIFMVGLLLSIVLLTALFGRVWCGWACPQTVYMEFVFRPIERLFDGTVGRGGVPKKPVPTWKTVAKYIVYFLVCVYLANTFLAYFVGVDRLKVWVTQSPLEHPIPFLVMAFVTGAMMFDFCFFREQMCIIACPYGRFQSVLLDQDSLIVAYDRNRGEPRGKKRKSKDGDLPILGDCVDCRNCVTTCPTGIDIRDGLQMECINCTQCIDACDAVMAKLGRAPNLIRYSSQRRDQGLATHLLRARTIIYPLLLAGVATAFFAVLWNKTSFDAVVLRELGNPYTITEDGRVQNLIRLKLTNRTREPQRFEVTVPEGIEFEVVEGDLVLEPEQMMTFHTRVVAPRDAFNLGRLPVELKFKELNHPGRGSTRTVRFKMIGPYN